MSKKRIFKKSNVKQSLHRSGRRWVFASAALLSLIAGGYAFRNYVKPPVVNAASYTGFEPIQFNSDHQAEVQLFDAASNRMIGRGATDYNALRGRYSIQNLNHNWRFANVGGHKGRFDPVNEINIQDPQQHYYEYVEPVRNSVIGKLDAQFDATHADGKLHDNDEDNYVINVTDKNWGKDASKHVLARISNIGALTDNAGEFTIKPPSGYSGWSKLQLNQEINDYNHDKRSVSIAPGDIAKDAKATLISNGKLINNGSINVYDDSGDSSEDHSDALLLSTINLGRNYSNNYPGQYNLTNFATWSLAGNDENTGPFMEIYDGNVNSYNNNFYVKAPKLITDVSQGDFNYRNSIYVSSADNNEHGSIIENNISSTDTYNSPSYSIIYIYDSLTRKPIGYVYVNWGRKDRCGTYTLKPNFGYDSDDFSIVVSNYGIFVVCHNKDQYELNNGKSKVYLCPTITPGVAYGGLGPDKPFGINLYDNGKFVGEITSGINSYGEYQVTLPEGWVISDGNHPGSRQAIVDVSSVDPEPALHVKPAPSDSTNNAMGFSVAAPQHAETLSSPITVELDDDSPDDQVGSVTIPAGYKTGEYRIDLPTGWVAEHTANHYVDVMAYNNADLDSQHVNIEPAGDVDLNGGPVRLQYMERFPRVPRPIPPLPVLLPPEAQPAEPPFVPPRPVAPVVQTRTAAAANQAPANVPNDDNEMNPNQNTVQEPANYDNDVENDDNAVPTTDDQSPESYNEPSDNVESSPIPPEPVLRPIRNSVKSSNQNRNSGVYAHLAKAGYFYRISGNRQRAIHLSKDSQFRILRTLDHNGTVVTVVNYKGATGYVRTANVRLTTRLSTRHYRYSDYYHVGGGHVLAQAKRRIDIHHTNRMISSNVVGYIQKGSTLEVSGETRVGDSYRFRLNDGEFITARRSALNLI